MSAAPDAAIQPDTSPALMAVRSSGLLDHVVVISIISVQRICSHPNRIKRRLVSRLRTGKAVR
jgi:hypothetical protein